MTTTLRRPPQVTSACLFVGVSSLLLLLVIVQALTSWGSIAVREQLDEAFKQAGAEATDERLATLRIVLQVIAVLLVAGLVCAVYTARRHGPSRYVLTAIALVVAFVFATTGGLLGLLPAVFAGYAILQLWSPPSRRWFRGEPEPERKAPTPPPVPADPFAERGSPMPTAPPVGPPVDVQHAPPPPGPPQAPQPYAPPPPGWPSQQAVPRTGTPKPVRTVDLVVSITSAVTALGSALFLAVHQLAYDELLQAQLDSPVRSTMNLSEAEIVDAMRQTAVICAIALVLSVAALGAVRLLARRRRFGHVATTVLSGVTVIVGLLTLVGIPWAALAVWVLVLLRRRETTAWLATREPSSTSL